MNGAAGVTVELFTVGDIPGVTEGVTTADAAGEDVAWLTAEV
jgi:hypothetical protein